MKPVPSREVLVVEAARTFVSAVEARAWALIHVRGHTAINKHTGRIIRIGRRALEKTTSESAVRKSSDATAHLAAVSVLLALLEEAVWVASHPDRAADPNVRQIHRFCAALRFRHELYRVKLTLKEFSLRGEGTGFYTYELAQIEMPAWNQAASCPEGQTSAPQAGIVKLADLLQGSSGNF